MIRRRARAARDAGMIEVINIIGVADHRLRHVSHGNSAGRDTPLASQMCVSVEYTVGAITIDRFGELIVSEERKNFAPLAQKRPLDR